MSGTQTGCGLGSHTGGNEVCADTKDAGKSQAAATAMAGQTSTKPAAQQRPDAQPKSRN